MYAGKGFIGYGEGGFRFFLNYGSGRDYKCGLENIFVWGS